MKMWLLGIGIHAIPALLGITSSIAAQHPQIGVPGSASGILGVVVQQLAMHGLSYMQAAYDQASAAK